MYIKNPFGPKQMDMLAKSVSLIKNIKETVISEPKGESESEQFKIIKQKDNAIYNYKQDKEVLRNQLKEMEQELTIIKELLEDANNKLCKEGIQ